MTGAVSDARVACPTRNIMRVPFERTLAASLTLFLGFACADAEHPLRKVQRGEAEVTGRGMLVIAIDGLRFDRTSLGRSDRDTTPCLARLAARGAVFSDVWSPMTERLDAHVALLTGCDPAVARRPVVQRADHDSVDTTLPLVVPEAAPSLAARFLAGGWTTAAFVDHPQLTRIRGLDRGFQSFTEYAGRGIPTDHRGDGVFGVGLRVIQWVNARALDEDWFAYVHMGDLERAFRREAAPVPPNWRTAATDEAAQGREQQPPRRIPVARDEPSFHTLPPSRIRGEALELGELELQYDAALLALDRSIERIVLQMDDFRRASNVTIVIVGTYGMPFGESGIYLEAGLPDGPDLRVPWVIRLPVGQQDHGLRLDPLASVLDVAPTLIDLAGVRPSAEMHGFSWAEEVRGAEVRPRRRWAFSRTGLGEGSSIASAGEHWGEFSPTLEPGALAESWTGLAGAGRRLDGAPAPEAPLVTSSLKRSAPGATDSLRFLEPTALPPSVLEEYSARWQRWHAALVGARDRLHFGGEDSIQELAEQLRNLQTE